MKDKLLVFIVPYFGKLPREMNCFLKTVAENKKYDWLIFTNDETEYCYPPNAIVHRMSFEDFSGIVTRKFEFDIALNTAMKLCDFKPAYGFILEEYIQEYQFWGYCDLDQYFGDLSKFINSEYLNRYDKVFSLGHMTIYRNNRMMNRLFMERDKRENLICSSYDDVFRNEKNCIFDEWPTNSASINRIAEQKGIRCSYDWLIADILPNRSHFEQSIYYTDKHEWSQEHATCSGIILWEKGKCYFVSKRNEICKEEVIYAHIQKRSLNMNAFNMEKDVFLIIPNRIISFNKELTNRELKVFLVIARVIEFARIDETKLVIRERFRIWKHHAYLLAKRLGLR